MLKSVIFVETILKTNILKIKNIAKLEIIVIIHVIIHGNVEVLGIAYVI